MHQKLTKAFGHKIASVLYIDYLMTLLCHHMNWKSFERNQPDFTQVCHFDAFLIGYINDIYESVFGFPKYVNWGISPKYMVETLPYGIFPLDKVEHGSRHVEPSKGITNSLHCLAFRQRSDGPYTGLKGKEEIHIFLQLFVFLFQENCSMSAMYTFHSLAKLWNQM